MDMEIKPLRSDSDVSVIDNTTGNDVSIIDNTTCNDASIIDNTVEGELSAVDNTIGVASDIDDTIGVVSDIDNTVTAEDILARRDEMLGIAEKRRISKRRAMNQYGKKTVVKAGTVQLNARKVFRDNNDFIVTFEHYINKVQKEDYAELPTLLNFARYVKCSPHTIQSYLYALTENDRKIYKSILADMLYQGVNAGYYDRQMTIFAMKNLCDWSDRVESTAKIEKKKDIISKEDADKLIMEYIQGLDEA